MRTCVLVVRQRACPACLPACPAVNGHVGGEGGRVGDTCLHGKSLKITQAHQVIDQRAYYHGLRACVRVHVYCACVPLGCPRCRPSCCESDRRAVDMISRALVRKASTRRMERPNSMSALASMCACVCACALYAIEYGVEPACRAADVMGLRRWGGVGGACMHEHFPKITKAQSVSNGIFTWGCVCACACSYCACVPLGCARRVRECNASSCPEMF